MGIMHLYQLISATIHRSSLHGCMYSDSGRQGQLTFEGRTYRVDLLDLPTVVESYKTLDDTNLVKTGDIGQVGHSVSAQRRLILTPCGVNLHEQSVAVSDNHLCLTLCQVLVVGGEVALGQTEAKDGVTPPMRNARERHFKKLPEIPPAVCIRTACTFSGCLPFLIPAC